MKKLEIKGLETWLDLFGLKISNVWDVVWGGWLTMPKS